jgi:dolichol kinase
MEQEMSIWKRKTYRIVMGSIFPVVYLATGRNLVPMIIGIFFLILLAAMEYVRWKHPVGWEYLLRKGKGMFKRQSGMLTGDTYFMLAVVLILVLFHKEIAVAALFFLVFGDAGSGVIGTRYGRTKIFHGKTLEGLAGGLLFNFAIALLIIPFLNVPLLLLMAGAVAASFVEVLPLRIDDNITVGLSSALVMYLLSV